MTPSYSDSPGAGGGQALASVDVGDLTLEVGEPSGTRVAGAARRVEGESAELARALKEAEQEGERETVAGAVSEAVDEAADATEAVERAASLFERIASGTLDPAQFRDEIDSLLDRLAQLDRSGRFAEALELARALEKLVALVKRWEALGRTLSTALRAARQLGDEEASAWARHELGTLQLAVGDRASAERNLDAAHELRERIGDRRGLEITEGNLQALCRQLRRLLRDGELVERSGALRPGWRTRALLAAGVAALLVAGGAAGALVFGGDGGGDGGGDDGGGRVDTDRTTETTPRGRGEHTIRVQPPRGGTISSRPPRLVCPGERCDARFAADSGVTLVATPEQGFRFARWALDCGPSQEPTCSLTMASDHAVGASFARAPPQQVTLTVSAENAVATSDPAGINCPSACSFEFPVGQRLTLTAAPGAGLAEGGSFSWSGACAGTPRGSDSCQVVLARPAAAQVFYREPEG